MRTPWIKDFSSGVRWHQRIPFSWDTTGKSTSTAYTGRLTIPEKFDAFWDAATAAELRVTSFDGRTAIPFDDVSLSIAGRSGYLIVRPTVTTAAKHEVGWLYWDADGTSVTDASTTIADATDLTFYLDAAGPVPPYLPMRSLVGQTQGSRLQKQAGETLAVYWRLPPGQRQPGGAAGQPGAEGVQHFAIVADPALTVSIANWRIVQDDVGSLFIKALVAGGSSGVSGSVVDLSAQSTTGQIAMGTLSLDTLDLT